MTIESLNQLVQSDIDAVDAHMKQELGVELPFINDLGSHLIHSGGKRLRPLTLVLSAKACGYEGDKHIPLASAMEFFHSATLLHDDVIDESTLRRGLPTANHLWGAKPSILVGDFLFTRSFQLLLQAQNIPIIQVLADTSNQITKGEVLQHTHCRNENITQDEYFEIITHKTAVLFSAAAQLGALLGEQDDSVVEALKSYGLHLGIAFQLLDDMLDYAADAETLGKNIGDDLAEGKPTLPLIHILQSGNEAQKQLVKEALKEGNRDHLAGILDAIEDTKALDFCKRCAQEQIDQALTNLQSLEPSPYRLALESLARYSLERAH